MIGTAVAMLVNARSSNHEPNREADRNPKQLSECNSLLCEEAHVYSYHNDIIRSVVLSCCVQELRNSFHSNPVDAKKNHSLNPFLVVVVTCNHKSIIH